MPLESPTIAIVGAGTIGLSFIALHLTRDSSCRIIIYDTRPDLQAYVSRNLPAYLIDADPPSCSGRLSFASSLHDAVHGADIVQEQGPEAPDFKIRTWPAIERSAPAHALFWSSTSGIPASVQSREMRDPSRLVVVHPYNPPHIMPLLEVVPSPRTTADDVVDRTVQFWRQRGRVPVVLRKECPGFVANRLAFALLREACSLVALGVVGVEELDDIVQASMGPRWAVAGPFKSYHAGGGEGGLRGFLEKIGGTVGKCWDASEEDIRKEKIGIGGRWQENVCKQAEDAYGVVDTTERDHKTRSVLQAVSS